MVEGEVPCLAGTASARARALAKALDQAGTARERVVAMVLGQADMAWARVAAVERD
jgi:hypothetical protein